MHKKCKCKNAMQNKCKLKKCTKMILDTRLIHILGGMQDMQSRLPGFHAFRFLNLPHMQSVLSFSSVWVSVPASTLEWALLFGKVGAHFPGDDPTEVPFVLLSLCFFVLLFRLLFCFAFLLLFFALFLLFTSVFCEFFQFRRSPIRIGDLPFRLITCPLGRREPQHWAFFFGFTGSPRTSLFKFIVFFVFCASFITTLSRLICCFHVCCIWHFPFSLVAFHLSIFSTYHVASFQLALVTSMYSSFVKCAPFQVAFALSILPPFAIFASFQLAFCFPIFSAIVMCASFRFAFSNSIFVALFLLFFKM